MSTGTNYSVKDLICKCLELLDIKYEWLGEGIEASVKDVKTNKTIIKVNEKYFRPAEVDTLIGNPNKIKSTLGWEPEYTFDMLVEEMIKFELDNSNIIF